MIPSSTPPPSVDVLVATYNGLSYLKSAVASVLDQSYRNLRLIIHDDGSTDGTDMWVGSLEDPRLTYIKRDHVGPDRLAEIANVMLDAGRGEYVAVLGGDDYYADARAIEELVTSADTYSADLVFGSARLVDEAGNPIPHLQAGLSLSDHATFGFSKMSPQQLLLTLLARQLHTLICRAHSTLVFGEGGRLRGIPGLSV